MNSLKEKFNSWWSTVDDSEKPKYLGALIAAVGLVFILFMTGKVQDKANETKAKNTPQKPSLTMEKKLLNSDRYSELSKDVLEYEMKKLKASQDEFKKDQLSRDKLFAKKIENQTKSVNELQGAMQDLQKNLKKMGKGLSSVPSFRLTQELPVTDNIRNDIGDIVSEQLQEQEEKFRKILDERDNKRKIFAKKEVLEFAKPSVKGDGEVMGIKSFSLNELSSDIKSSEKRGVKSEPGKDMVPDVTFKDLGSYLPTASIVQGVVLSGMDAPTFVGSKEDPRPVTVRLKMDAILPNGYKSDIKECFLVGSGFGSLDSQRVHLRSEVMTCINDDGYAIEVPLDAYAVSDSDGKEGVRGRLVSREGALIARSIGASFIEGVGQAFSPASSLTSSAITSSPFENPSADKVVQNSAMSGASSAMKNLAAFYQKMAMQMYPVIELDAGREVTFILTKGVDLKPLVSK